MPASPVIPAAVPPLAMQSTHTPAKRDFAPYHPGTSVSPSADTAPVSRTEWLALAILIAGAAAMRLLYLEQPMRYDEAFSYLYYVLPSLRTAVSDYSYPNNHVFHTVLVWVTTRLFGSSPEAIRLPVFVAGVLVVPAVWLAARALAARGAGVFAAAVAAALPALILYSTNARAYMIECVALLVLIWLSTRLLDRETTGLWAAFVVTAALGMWSTPVMLYPVGAIGLWLLVEQARLGGAQQLGRFLPRIALAAAAAIALTALLYLPIIMRGEGGLIFRNRFVTPLTWPQFMHELSPFVLGLRELIGLGLTRAVGVVAVLLALVGVAAPGEQRARRVTLALATAAWCGALMVATRHPPPARMWLFLAPLWCLYAGVGLAWLATLVPSRRASAHVAGALFVFVLLAAEAVRSRAVLTTEESDWIGMRDAREVAALVAAGRPDDRVVVNRASGPPIDYYLYHLTGRRLASFQGAERNGRVVVVVDDRHRQRLERIQALHPDVAWQRLGPPTLLRKFPGASVYAFAPALP